MSNNHSKLVRAVNLQIKKNRRLTRIDSPTPYFILARTISKDRGLFYCIWCRGNMARINIEDSLFKDQRWWKLMIKTQCEYKALGLIVKAWILAQEHWLKYKSIPAKTWPKELNILIDVEFASKRENGDVYIKGSKKAFAWLDQRSNAGKHKNRQNQYNDKGVERPLTERNGMEPLTLSLTLPLNTNTKKRTKGDGSTNRSADFIGIYVKAFQKRYPGSRPEISGKVLGQIKTFLKDRTFERSCDLIQAYFQMEDPWFLKKAHDFSTFLSNIQKISTSLDMGVEDPNSELAKFSRKMALREKEEELLLESN